MKRQILDDSQVSAVTVVLQRCLYDLIDLSLQGKEAHWNVIGPGFRSIHLQLDEIIEASRAASDDVAERIATLGVAAVGGAAGIAKESRLEGYPAGLQCVEATVSCYADRLANCISELRNGIDAVGNLDPISEDLLIGVSAVLEKHLWMIQAQEE